MKNKTILFILLTGVVLIGLSGYIFSQHISENNKQNQSAKEDSNTKTELSASTEETSETQASQITEVKKNKKLPKNYEWDKKRWGEPPQIVYDFAEYQEKFDSIVNKIDSIVSDSDGFTAIIENGKIDYITDYNNINRKLNKKFKNNVTSILKETKFYTLCKEEGGDWVMYYNQDEYTEKYIYTMIYRTGMTEEQAYEEGFIKVVGDWYFYSIWKV